MLLQKNQKKKKEPQLELIAEINNNNNESILFVKVVQKYNAKRKNSFMKLNFFCEVILYIFLILLGSGKFSFLFTVRHRQINQKQMKYYCDNQWNFLEKGFILFFFNKR